MRCLDSQPARPERTPRWWQLWAATFATVLLGWMAPSGFAPVAAQPATADLRGRQVDALFSGFDQGASPGVAVMVIRDGEVVHSTGHGFADLERLDPISPSTAFRLASVSKQFAATAVMLLAERQELAYGDPVTKYLPELSRFGSEMTLQHLLTHTSGLPDYYDALAAQSTETMPTNEDALGFLAEWGEPLFAPGERYEYSNPGYEMLALVVERVSGKPFGRFLEEDLFRPLDMQQTIVFDSREPVMEHRAYGYSRTDDGFEINDSHPLNHVTGSGGVYSTLEDFYLWDQALYTERPIAQATLERAWQPMPLASGGLSYYGFGWRLGSYGALGRRIAHAGGWLGFSTYFLRYPDSRFSVVLLSNLEDFDGEQFADRITDIYYPSTVIRGATVVDGTGAPGVQVDVRIVGDRITEVGALAATENELTIDGRGRVLAPGFIDAHSHADSAVLDRPDAMGALNQGITTVVTGQDGDSRFPLSEFYAELGGNPSSVNLASYAGHGTLRSAVLGDDFRRPATAEEIQRMAALLATEMDAGALGLSTGLEYDPGIYSSADEVITLARVAANYGGRYISHIRSEDREFWAAIEEILTLGKEAELPVQISHIKLAMRSLHGQSQRLLDRLDRARAEGVEVTADIYPYTYWQATLTVMFPDRDYEDPAAAAFAVEELSSPEGMLIPVFKPDPAVAGKTLAAVAAARGTDPATTLIDLIKESEAMRAQASADAEDSVESVIAMSMQEDDIEQLMAWPHTVFCTDGGLDGTHPRGFGAFPRILGRYVRERGVLSPEEAVHRMSGLTAAQLGISDRGTIAPGMVADLVLFDPRTVLDRATTDEPQATSIGIDMVWVGGQLVLDGERSTSRRPGSIILRHQPRGPSTTAADGVEGVGVSATLVGD